PCRTSWGGEPPRTSSRRSWASRRCCWCRRSWSACTSACTCRGHTSPDTTHRPAGPSGGTLLADRREQCCDVGPAAAATRRSTRVLGDLLDGRKRAVTDRVDDLAACHALAGADVEVRIQLGGGP